MKNIKIDVNAARLLLVEGRDDAVFFLKLIEHMDIRDDFKVRFSKNKLSVFNVGSDC